MSAVDGPRVRIAGFVIADFGFDRAKSALVERLISRRQLKVFFANAHFATVSRDLVTRVQERDDVLILNDGLGLNLASLICRRAVFQENLNGTDFLPRFLENIDRPIRIFLLGSQPRTVQGAAKSLAAIPNVKVAGYCDGFSFWEDEFSTLAAINDVRPDILLVALGCPKQENWILDNAEMLDVPLIFGVGAFFDFMSKELPRAPRFMRRLQLEWLYRLSREPRRLAYRYTIEFMLFIALVIQDRWVTRPRGEAQEDRAKVLTWKVQAEVSTDDETLPLGEYNARSTNEAVGRIEIELPLHPVRVRARAKNAMR